MTIAALALSAATLAATLALFVALKREMWRFHRDSSERAEATAGVVAAIRTEMDAVRAQFADLEDRTGMLAAPPPVRSGLNMSRRSQATRMVRRGDSPAQIAAALGLPVAEARLLATVERLRASDESRSPAAV